MASPRAQVETVPADMDQAREHIRTAERFLADGAVTVLSNEARFSMLYDAARNAVTAVLAAHGVRVTSGHASHAVTITEASRRLGPKHAATFKRLNVARNQRNQLQYHTAAVSAAQVRTLETDAAAIVAAARDAVEVAAGRLR